MTIFILATGLHSAGNVNLMEILVGRIMRLRGSLKYSRDSTSK